ncbi:hypothetical protein SKAU_G00097430 [Synaphobranchus kaupii]|uniref:Uncharacterized protein n=1 Tax=Synaphobranchus kaupii TaxID=118154 RepID=A0A9Q1FYT4_SYNKA|nr:hypothetical protein SKAU_G00097430 [Synaphobranchus kaupii]
MEGLRTEDDCFLGRRVLERGRPVIQDRLYPATGLMSRCVRFNIKNVEVGSYVQTDGHRHVRVIAIWIVMSERPTVLFEGTAFLPLNRRDILSGCEEYKEGGHAQFTASEISETLVFLHHKCFWKPDISLGIGTKSTATQGNYCEIVNKKVSHNRNNNKFLKNAYLHSHPE